MQLQKIKAHAWAEWLLWIAGVEFLPFFIGRFHPAWLNAATCECVCPSLSLWKTFLSAVLIACVLTSHAKEWRQLGSSTTRISHIRHCKGFKGFKDSSQHLLLTVKIFQYGAQKMRTHVFYRLLSFCSNILKGWEGETWDALQINIFHPNTLFKDNRGCRRFVCFAWGQLHCFCWLKRFTCNLAG